MRYKQQKKQHKEMSIDSDITQQLSKLYLKNIKMLKEDIQTAITDRDKIMKEIIESSYNKFTNAVQVGSFAKHTNIQKSNFDFDLLVICNTQVATVVHQDSVSVALYDRHGYIESAALWLTELQHAVEKVCARGSITRTRVAIKLRVNREDGTCFLLDMIPTIVVDQKEYVPDYSQTTAWKQNFSRKDVRILKQRNNHYRDLKVVIKLLKYISNKYRWKNIPSYALECLVLYYSDRVTVREWNSLSLASKLLKVLHYLVKFLADKHMSHRFIPTENLLQWLSDADVVKILSDIRFIVDNHVAPILIHL